MCFTDIRQDVASMPKCIELGTHNTWCDSIPNREIQIPLRAPGRNLVNELIMARSVEYSSVRNSEIPEYQGRYIFMSCDLLQS